MKPKSTEEKHPANTPPGREKRLADLQKMHTPLIGQHVYRNQLKSLAKDDAFDDSAVSYIADVLVRMKTRDPLEEMLVMQALWTHTRLAHLSILANQQTSTNNVKVINDACDRAANTFRRQLLALGEYRRPRRTDAFVAIKQANVAQQQVIANGQIPNSNKPLPSNEVGLPSPILQVDAPRIGVAPPVCPAAQAVAAEHRAQDDGGKGPRQDECP